MQINKVVESRNLHTIREMVESFDGEQGRHPALNMRVGDSYVKTSYAELGAEVRALGNGLLVLGVAPGDRVGILSENRSEWIAAYLAVTASGAVAVPFDILLKREELANVARASGARMLFTSREYLAKAEYVRADCPSLERLVLFDEPLPDPQHRDVGFRALASLGADAARSGRNLYESSRPAPQDLAALIYTSGTTGAPKGVMLSHRCLVANGDAVQMTTRLGAEDNWIIVLPLHHTYPTALGIFVPLLSGGMVTTVPTLKSSVLIQTMKDTSATCLPAMPALVEKLYKGVLQGVKAKPIAVRVGFGAMLGLSRLLYRLLGLRIGKALFGSVARELGLERLRFIISGGGPIAKEIIDGMNALGLWVYQGYGLTETSPVVSSTCPAHDKPGTVGLPLVNLEVRIAEPDAAGNGEILVRGPSVMLGYQGMPEKTREVIDAEGWLHTGDVGQLDRDGYLSVTGRIKNILVTKGGKNIYPEEIENALLQSPYIAQAIVLGRDDGEHGERPYAVVFPNADGIGQLEKERGERFTQEELRELMKQEIRARCKSLAPYKVPDSFDISVEELPKTSSNKVKRYLFAKK